MGKKSQKPPATAEPSDAADVLEMLKASARRTDAALPPPPSAFESMGEAEPAALVDSNPPDAVMRRLKRRARTDAAAAAATENLMTGGPFEAVGVEPVEIPGLERIIGRDMLMQISYLEAGQIAARSVAHIQIRDERGRSRGFGTGFLVSPKLLLTNNHVLPNAAIAKASRVEFFFQRQLDGSMAASVVRELDPQSFFLTSPMKELDFTLVAVQTYPPDSQIAEVGFHPLVAVEDEILAGECVTIIQHPKGDPKQIVLRDNEVLKLPTKADQFLHYKTGTHPGSSGSPVFNDSWEVIALHHAGKPETDSAGNPLTADGTRWEPGMDLDRIKWVANEGVRVAAIVKYVSGQELTDAQMQLFEAALSARTTPVAAPKPGPTPAGEIATLPFTLRGNSSAEDDDPDFDPLGRADDSSATDRAAPTAVTTVANVDGGLLINVPLQISIRLGSAAIAAAGAETPGTEEKIEIDRNYSTREGYDPEFLGVGNLLVPLPKLTEAMLKNAAVNRESPEGAFKHELQYHHFSVVMNQKRRLAYFTAVNIDGRQIPKSEGREKDRWIFDPRIDETAQIGNTFYKGTQFDRGHLVRRLDPAWGRTPHIVKTANDDTFHFSNCSPQHKRFNQGKNLWAGLENYLLGRSKDERKRMTVFTGPVFRKTDPPLRGLPIPLHFWKVAVLLSTRGGLVSVGFLVSQEDLVRATVEEVTAEEVARTFQVSVRKIESLTDLDFGSLTDVDATRGLDMFEAIDADERELDSLDEIVLNL